MEFIRKREDFGAFGLEDNAEEKFLVDMFSKISGRLKHKYSYSDEEIMKMWNSHDTFQVPVAIFAGKLSPAEALAKFLKENYNLGFRDISGLIGRGKSSIWSNYKRAAKKMPWPFQISNGVSVPVSIFTPERSVLESLVNYLKDVKRMRNKQIAQLLNKNSANVWTAYHRAKKKMIKDKEIRK
ncbi:sigma-70 region 4 domain-containing protein [Candidatus Woesearchaeota archaeon]|nr:sigma-70 region 4 domain-containing protein [Candidatus Woesearchaeota archaeon]